MSNPLPLATAATAPTQETDWRLMSLLLQMSEIQKRVMRIETRLVVMMEELGCKVNSKPQPHEL